MRVAIYSIALNEEKFAERWADTTKDADYVLVADTGSTDATLDILKKYPIKIVPISVQPFRFDDARNASLALLPHDIDVAICLDMDEILTPGWRQQIEACWKPATTRLRYRYVWSWNAANEADLIYYGDKISGRHTHRWKGPAHEVMTAIRPEVAATCHGVLIEHHPDPMKPRSQYLDLLRLAATEDPTDDRSSHYLGREYFYNAMYQQAIDELLRHLALPKAIWESERAASMRYVGKCYEGLGNPQAAQEWYVRAVLEEASRETLIEAARFSLTRQAFYATVAYCQQALTLPVVGGGYMEERYARAEGPYDLMAVALWHIAASDPQRDQALTYARQALSYNPSDPRLIKNLHMMQSGL